MALILPYRLVVATLHLLAPPSRRPLPALPSCHLAPDGCCVASHCTALSFSIATLFVLRGFHQTMPLPLNAPITAATAAATAVAAVTATTVVELTIVYCLRKSQQQHHGTSSSTDAKRLTRPDDLDLFYLSTVFEVCDG
jgi:hypothetical protein